jgi:hypothetical protein
MTTAAYDPQIRKCFAQLIRRNKRPSLLRPCLEKFWSSARERQTGLPLLAKNFLCDWAPPVPKLRCRIRESHLDAMLASIVHQGDYSIGQLYVVEVYLAGAG